MFNTTLNPQGLCVHVCVSARRYDAGDNVKFNFPMAWSAHVMAWSIVDFADVSTTQLRLNSQLRLSAATPACGTGDTCLHWP